MRTVSYKEVLWAIAYEQGIDPDITRNGQGIMPDQADAWTSFANAWVRRLFDQGDYPDWTPTRQFAVPANHIVPWSEIGTIDFGGSKVDIGRSLKVYLVDPNTTWSPVDTPFRLSPSGIHVGFDHGSSVWIRYVIPCPQFTAREWSPDAIYQKDQLTYSDLSGECYKSKVNGNQGHDPTLTYGIVHQPPPTPPSQQPPNQLPNEIVVPLIPDDPGNAVINKILVFDMMESNPSPQLTNPPPSGTFFSVVVLKEDTTAASIWVHTADGIETLEDIIGLLYNQQTGDLTGLGFTVTLDTANFTITLEHDSGFYFDIHTIWTDPDGNPVHYFKIRQVQAYVPAVGATDGTRQVIEMPLTAGDIVEGATYTLTFKDLSGVDHTVEYVAQPLDGPNQILSELISLIGAQGVSDSTFGDIHSSLDTASGTASFSSSKPISLDSSMTLPGSPWWEVVRLPFILMDQVVRGSVADDLKATGQSDRAGAEEQAVTQEVSLTQGKILAPEYDTMTDQIRQ